MKKLILLSLGLLLSLLGLTQTKVISFRSHSGSMHNFALALSNPSNDIHLHNLGMAPQRTVQMAEIDSVIFISDTVAVMITSVVCEKNAWFYQDEPKANLDKKTLWSAGTDTVYNHPLFSKQHALDSIKTVLKEDYYFKNDIDSTVFIGFDNESKNVNNKENEDHNSAPFVIPENNSPTIGPMIFISIIGLIALLLGLISMRFSELKKSNFKTSS